MRFDTTGESVVTASEDKTVRRWDVGTGTLIAPALVHDAPVAAAAPLHNGRIVTVTATSAVTIWDRDGQSQILSPPVSKEEAVPGVVAISIDARWIFSSSRNSGAKLYDTATGSVRMLTSASQDIGAAYFSHDGNRLLIVAGEHSFVMDVETGILRSTMSGHYPADQPGQSTDKGTAGDFTPGGNFLITSSNAGARVWEVETGLPQYDLIGHQAIVRSAQFSPDGRWIVTATGTSDPDDGRAGTNRVDC